MSSGRIRVVIDWEGFSTWDDAAMAVCEALDEFNEANRGVSLYWVDDRAEDDGEGESW